MSQSRQAVTLVSFLTAVLVISFVGSTQAQTIVSGNITGTWSSDGNPYIVTANISVVDSLIIEPGVIVQVQAGGLKIEAAGGDKLVARGTEEAPVIFEPFSGTTPGLWQGIRIISSGNDDVLSHCDIGYAVNGVDIQNSQPTIEFCRSHDHTESGIYMYQGVSGTVIRSCTFDNSANGIYLNTSNLHATVVLESSLFRDNHVGVRLYSWATGYQDYGSAIADIRHCTITRNEYGIYASGGEIHQYGSQRPDAFILNSIISFNTISGMENGGFGQIGADDITYNCIWNPDGINFQSVGNSGILVPGGYINANGDECDVNLNIYVDPEFADAAAQDFGLMVSSLCIDAGNLVVGEEIVYDPDGTNPDLGAFTRSASSPPENVQAEAKSDRVLLGWNPGSNDVSARYFIYRSETDVDEFTAKYDSTEVDVVEYEDMGGNLGTRYYYRIKSELSTGLVSVLSDQVCATPGDTEAPASPGTPIGTADDRIISLEWPTLDIACDITAYIISRTPDGGTQAVIDTIPATTDAIQTFSDSVENYVEYCYSIQALDNAGNMSAHSEIVCDMAVGPVANLTLTTNVDEFASLGDHITYTLDLSNAGPDDSGLTVVRAELPEGVTYISHDPPGAAYGVESGDWEITSLTLDEIVSLAVTVSVDTAATIVFESSVESEDSSDLNPEDNTATAILQGQACDIQVASTVNNPTPNVGETVLFRVVVTNDGPSTAENVLVTDDLPEGIADIDINKSGGSYINNVWRLGNMEPGRVDWMEISARVVEPIIIENTASATVDYPADLNLANNDSTATLSAQSADLVVTMDHGFLPILDDELVNFEVTVHNNGPSVATGIQLMNVFSGFTNPTVTEPEDTTYEDGTWTFDEPLEAGQHKVLILQIQRDGDQTMTSRIEVVSMDQTDPDPNNNAAFSTVSNEILDLRIGKSVDQEFPSVGDTITFTVTAYNEGASIATNVRVLDLPAEGLSYAGSTVTSGEYTSITGVWSVPSLAVTTEDTLKLKCVVEQPIDITNTASLISVDQSDDDSGNNRAEQLIHGQAADLSLVMTVESVIEDEATFILAVTNRGPHTARDIIIHDVLPDGFGAWGVTYDTGVYDGNQGEFGTWDIPELAVDAIAYLNMTIPLTSSLPLINEAELISSTPIDPRDDNNTAWAGFNAAQSDIALTMTVDNSTPDVNTDVTFTLSVSVSGDDVSNVVVAAELPAGLTMVEARPAGNYSAGLWTIGDISGLTTVELEIDATIDVIDVIVFDAEIASSNAADLNPNNDADVVVVTSQDPAPLITTNGLLTVTAGDNLEIVATVTDNSNVATVTLLYRTSMTDRYTSAVMSQLMGDDTYGATIPGTDLTGNGIDCRITAIDDQGQQTNAGVQISVAVGSSMNPTAQPGGSSQNAYRMVSVPLQLDNPSPDAVLSDDLGDYGEDRWRLFGLDASQVWSGNEYPNSGDMTLGRGFFLIVSESGKQIDTGAGITTPMNEPYVLNLHMGWNLIGSPFNVDFPLSGVTLETTDAFGTLIVYDYEAVWTELSAASPLKPFHGYLVRAYTNSDRLVFDPTTAWDKSLTTAKSSEPHWGVSVTAQVQDASDVGNMALVADAAFTTRDSYDRPEPPVIGDYVTVSFAHDEWDTPYPNLAKDARPPSADGGWTWDMEVSTSINDRVMLTFDDIASVPADLEIWLRDELLMVNTNLRETDNYSFVGASSGAVRNLSLVIGDADYVAARLPASESIPEVLVLKTNFPNPFNPLTTIRYGVPREGKIRLGVYDVRGRLVKLLVDEMKPAGYHAVVWEGDDERGSRVASGVYLYRVVSDDESKVSKMLLMK